MTQGLEFEELRALVATRTRRIIVWCGSGLSAAAGIPTWGPLQRKLEEHLKKKLESLDFPEAQREVRVRAIRQEKNPWVAFERLESALGITLYRAAVKSVLAKAASVEVPEIYRLMWGLRPAGVINFNLDRLATRGFVEGGGKGLIEFKGKDIGPHTYTLGSRRQFICNIHGVEEDVESWVFTQRELRELAATETYKNYVSSALSSASALFLGISADDMAVGGHLDRLSGIGAISGPHFWITDRKDQSAEAWAEKNGVLIIRYRATSDHPELVKLLNELRSHVQPEEEGAPPVSLDLGLSTAPLESPSVLAQQDPERVRVLLNAKAAEILRGEGSDALEKYEEFSREYDRAVHTAWYTSTEPGENLFLGCELQEEIARGAFGLVFRAKDHSGDEIAIKLLHAEIRKKKELLHAFRRGARSMRILAERGVRGIVNFRAASEFPATLIMDWVNGQNLNELVKSGQFVEWDHILEVSFQLADVIAAAHAIPERVLHRDIRPANVMVNGFWEDDPLEVNVLDFDLSWHRGSVEKSVIFGSQLSGYLAPEQVQRKQGVSTQHASVDSYGLGMTLFFMVAARDPSPSEHAHAGWRAALLEACQKPRGGGWRSLPQRILRLIFAATQEHQEFRWDISQIRSELSMLRAANRAPSTVVSAEFWAEEIAARSGVLSGYNWNDGNFSVEKDFGTGLAVVVSGDEGGKSLRVEMSRVATGADDRNRIVESLYRVRDLVTRIFTDGGWNASGEIGQSMVTIVAAVDIEDVAISPDKYADSIRKACDRMVFS